MAAIDLSTRYPDHKEFVPRAKWLVEMALKNTSALFNYSVNTCKACCATVPMQHQEWHLKEHAYALNLIDVAPKGKAPETLEAVKTFPVESIQAFIDNNFSKTKSQLQLDVEATLFDTLSESADFRFDWGYGPLSTALAESILSLTTEADVGNVALCTDCINDEGG